MRDVLLANPPEKQKAIKKTAPSTQRVPEAWGKRPNKAMITDYLHMLQVIFIPSVTLALLVDGTY